jgi:hypothetical protein
MLSPAERTKIELEERYRSEIRGKLDSASSKKWKVLNSPFTLWVLSALVVTGLGSAWSLYQENRKTHRENRAAIDRLDAEIGFRFSQIQGLLATYRPGMPEEGRDFVVTQALNGLQGSSSSQVAALYPTYERHSLAALVAELRRYLSLEGLEDPEVSSVLTGLSSRNAFFETQNASLKEPAQMARAIGTRLIARRWKGRGFYLLEGNAAGGP